MIKFREKELINQLGLFTKEDKVKAIQNKKPAEWVNPEVREGRKPDEYDESHPWFYILGGKPRPASKIGPRKFTCFSSEIGKKRLEEIKRCRKNLKNSVKHYREMIKNGPKIFIGSYDSLMHEHDEEYCSSEFMAWSVALGLVNAHISYYLSMLFNKQLVCEECKKPLFQETYFGKIVKFICHKCGQKYEATCSENLKKVNKRSKPCSQKKNLKY